MANKIEMQGVQVRTDKGDVWFLDSTRMGWVPKAQILAQPTLVLEKLKSEGFDVADDCIDELIVRFRRRTGQSKIYVEVRRNDARVQEEKD